jgi:HAE1 family hydrophobic/amphiphilic exporter-1/multidrug efflux pump
MAVIGGMVSGTVLAIFFVPLFFVIIMTLFSRKPSDAPQGQPAISTEH